MMAARRRWTAAEDDRLRAAYSDARTNDLARELNHPLASVYQRARFLGVAKSETYLAGPHACRLRRGDHVGKSTQFKPGQVPPNKGTRRPGWAPGRMRETQFKGGVRQGVAAKLYKPIGTERLSKEGYLERKVNDDLPLQARWRAVHLILWEASNGPVPRGYAIAFRNGDRSDIRLENLEYLSRAELMARNTVHNLPAPLPQTIQLLGALTRQIRKRTRGQEQDRRPA